MHKAKSIEEIRQSIASVPWEHLAHAYGRALDAPEKLELFLVPSLSEEALDNAVEWLWSSILHQGNIYSASPPVLDILIDTITAKTNHAAAEAILHAVQIITDGLHRVGDISDGEERSPVSMNKPDEPLYESWCDSASPRSRDRSRSDADYFTAIYVQSSLLRDLVRHSIPAICLHLHSSGADIRTAALAAGLGALQTVPDDAKPLAYLIETIGDPAYDPGAWVSVAMVFGEMGHNFSVLLEHPDRRIRLAAAMSSSTGGDSRSIAELASALSEPEWLEAEFPKGLAHRDMHLRFHVLQELLRRTRPENSDPLLIDAICALLRKRAHKYTVDCEWGPVLRWAFPERLIPLPQRGPTEPLPDTLTSTQVAILEVLVDKADLWDPSSGNASLAFKYVQLPYDRVALGRLIPGRQAPANLWIFDWLPRYFDSWRKG